jgi:hypothetical protein
MLSRNSIISEVACSGDLSHSVDVLRTRNVGARSVTEFDFGRRRHASH